MRHEILILLVCAVLAPGLTACGVDESQLADDVLDLQLRVHVLERRLGLSQEDEQAPYSKDQVEWIRGLVDVLDQEKKDKSIRRAIRNRLERSGVQLTDEQFSKFADAILSLRKRLRAELKKSAERGDAPQSRGALVMKHHEAFVQSLYDLIPAGDADKIRGEIWVYSGFSTR